MACILASGIHNWPNQGDIDGRKVRNVPLYCMLQHLSSDVDPDPDSFGPVDLDSEY